MTFTAAISSVFRHYAIFSGRAPRSEFWYWALFVCLASFAAQAIDAVALPADAGGSFNQLTSLVLLLPGLAVGARRLHDIGRTGWWQLLILTLIGVIPLLIWSCMRGTDGPNRYGSDPLATGSPRHLISTAASNT